MGQATYPKPVNEVLATLVEIFQHQKKSEIVELLSNAYAQYDEINYDNWNGGTTTWALRLEVPVGIFASIEPRLDAVKEEIEGKLRVFKDLYSNDFLHKVIVSPVLKGTTTSGQRMTPSENEARHLWEPNTFRLFLTHVSLHQAKVSMVKEQLLPRGIAAFVAHKDVTPTLEWQAEIELALRSMHALAAFITPEIHGSLWCNQEIGWACGRGVLALPIRVGSDPSGFAGKVQAVSGSLDNPTALADAVVRSLLTCPQTHGEMRRALVAAFSGARYFEMAKSLRTHLLTIDDFTEEDKIILHTACAENSQVKKAFGVVSAIYGKIGEPPKAMKIDAEIPF